MLNVLLTSNSTSMGLIASETKTATSTHHLEHYLLANSNDEGSMPMEKAIYRLLNAI